jgi:hypothetical protein
MKNKDTLICTICSDNKGRCTEACLPKDWQSMPNGVYTSETMKFELTEAQVRKFRAWESTKPNQYLGTIDKGFTISFIIIGTGLFSSAKCWDGTEIDLTEYYTP